MSGLIEIGKTYTHYKEGNKYTVLNIAKHSETGERFVVYRAEYGWKDVFVRHSSMWNEVIPEDRRTEYGQSIRFKLINEDVMDEEWFREAIEAYKEMKLV